MYKDFSCVIMSSKIPSQLYAVTSFCNSATGFDGEEFESSGGIGTNSSRASDSFVLATSPSCRPFFSGLCATLCREEFSIKHCVSSVDCGAVNSLIDESSRCEFNEDRQVSSVAGADSRFGASSSRLVDSLLKSESLSSSSPLTKLIGPESSRAASTTTFNCDD